MNNNKIIFLDIDGVLNTPENWGNWVNEELKAFTPECVANLNQLIANTGAQLVISSTWRIDRTVEQLQTLLNAVGVQGTVIGKTPCFADIHPRGVEIKSWIQQNCEGWPNYVILDDNSDMEDLLGALIQCDCRLGLTEFDVVCAECILKEAK